MWYPELQSSNKIWVWPSSRGSYTISWSWCTLPYCCAIMHNNLHEEWMLHHIIWRGSSTFQRNSVYHYCPCVLLPHFHLANLHHWVDSLQAQHCTCKNSGIHMVIKKDYKRLYMVCMSLIIKYSIGTGKSTSSMCLSTFSVPPAAGILWWYSSETWRHPYSVRRTRSEMKIILLCQVILLATV